MTPGSARDTSTAVPGTATTIKHTAKQNPVVFKHPLDPLTPDEIITVTRTIRHYHKSKTTTNAHKFITCSLLPPPKKAVLAHLGIPLVPGEKPADPVPIVRKAESDFIDDSGRCFNAILSLKEGNWVVDSLSLLDKNLQPQISVEELIECEHIVKNDKRVQELAKEVGVLPEQIFCDGWSIGYDERFPQHTRVQQGILFARYSRHDNLYAHPLDFIPVVDAHLSKVIHIDFAPQYKQGTPPVLTSTTTAPPPLSEDPFAASNRERVLPPIRPFNFLPDLMEEDEPGFKLRNDIKPLHIVQPEGVSFKVDGHVLEWQNWKMHIAFSQREGIALSTITYNDHGKIRPIMYRLSLAEMVVPYGAPEHPHPRKFAFDAGEYGMGTMANELSLGCDCLGKIHYLPGSYVAHDGSAIEIKNVICIHEEDSGVLWKHTDFRPGGRAQTVRRRRLVVSMVCTLANYEYIWNYHFYQDGSIEFEIRLTGILQVYVNDKNEPTPFGTRVAPNINAHYHQHMFSIRVDPMIDGLYNSVIESDIVPLPDAETGSKDNFAGNAFITQDTVLAKESGRPYDFEKERRWRIVNPTQHHYASGIEAGYAIGLKGGATPMMQRSNSWAAKRAAFLRNAFWVCVDEEQADGSGRMWPAGKYVPQTRDEPKDSIGNWVKGEKSVEKEDLLVYLTVGTTHIPRPEDWPVMPAETLSVTFKPSSFFDVNPSMDVPGVKDLQSAAAFDVSSATQNGHANGNANGHANGNANGNACHC